jgi:aryl-alcohol dehydrogenase-like predicted oxidoreductase
VIGFGTWAAGGKAWGPNPPDEQTVRAMEVALDAGVTWIDTAEVYGGGRSEELVAKAVAGRDDALVFTKVAPSPGGTGFRPEEVRRAAEQSIERLGRDHIDLLQLHWPDPNETVPIEETWGAMAGLVDDGLVRYIGVSNFGRELIERCEKVRHVDSLQPHFSMLFQRGRDDLYPFCAENGTGVIAYGPLAYGLLTGTFTKDTTFSDDDWRGGGHGVGYYKHLFAPDKFEQQIDKVERLRPIAEHLEISLPELALAWVFHQRGVTGAIAGSRSPDHVEENVRAGDIELDETTLEEIDAALA